MDDIMENKLKIDIKKTSILIVSILVLFFISWIAFSNGAQRIWLFFVELCVFMVQAFMIVAGALALQFCAQAVRANHLYDINGAGAEMDKVQDRIGTKTEKANDGISCSIKYTGWTIFSAIVLLSFFLLHTP